MPRTALILALVSAASLLETLPAQSCGPVTVVVDSQANIFGAGHALPPAPGGGGPGMLPTEIPLTAFPGISVRFPSVSGGSSWSGGTICCPVDADGSTVSGTDITSFDGVGGIILGGRKMFLVGAFLDASEPVDPAPAPTDFTANIGFTTLSPALREVFFIGDGLTGTGSGTLQTFFVPGGATRLCLGYADAFNFQGLPGYYQDNNGQLTVIADVGFGSGTATVLGAGCGGGPVSPSLWALPPVLGQTWSVTIDDVAPNQPGALYLSCLPPAPLPFLPGCDVWVDVLNLLPPLPFLSDATGTWSLGLVLPPNVGLEDARFVFQAVVPNSVAPVGIDLTNGLVLCFSS